MEIRAITNKAQTLVNAINKKINDGELKTWGIVKNAQDEVIYTHTPAQWNETAMPKPSVEIGRAVFAITHWKTKEDQITDETRGYVLGRFVEILMVHFCGYFDRIEIIK